MLTNKIWIWFVFAVTVLLGTWYFFAGGEGMGVRGVDWEGEIGGNGGNGGNEERGEGLMSKKEQNLQFQSQDEMSMGVYNPSSSRKLAIQAVSNAASQASSAVPNSLAQLLGATFARNSFSSANSNSAAFGGDGFANTNAATSSFSAPGFSVSIAHSVAIGANTASTASTASQSGATSGQASAAASGLKGQFPTASFASSISATIGGNTFSDSKSVSIAGGSALPNFLGKYQLSFPRVALQVTLDQFVIKGCKTYNVPYTWQSQNIKLGASDLTRPDCGYDPAFSIAQRIPLVVKFKRNGNDLICLSRKNETLFIFKQWESSKKLKRADQDFYEYAAELPSYNIEIDQNQLLFDGYADSPIEFQYSSPDLISFGRYPEVRRKLGFYDEDNSVADFFASCSRVRPRGEGKGFSFLDQSGKSLAECSPKDW